jgi:hypothetical protein
MTWQVYKGECEGRLMREGPPVAAFSRQGQIRLSMAVARQMPEMCECVLLHDLDAEPPKIGLKLIRNGDDVAFKKKLKAVNKRSGGMIFNAKKFLVGKCGLDLSETRRYPAAYDESKRIVVITLEPIERKNDKARLSRPCAG